MRGEQWEGPIGRVPESNRSVESLNELSVLIAAGWPQGYGMPSWGGGESDLQCWLEAEGHRVLPGLCSMAARTGLLRLINECHSVAV